MDHLLFHPSRSEMVEISHSLQLCITFPTHIGKKKIFTPHSGAGVIRACVSVRLSVCAWPRKSAVTFERGDGSARNFQGRPYSRRVIFGRVTRTPDPSESGPGSIPELCVRALTRTPGAPRAGGSKFQSQNRGFFIKAKLKWTTPCFIFVQKPFREMHPWGPRGPGKSGKSRAISGSLNKKLEFGLSS